MTILNLLLNIGLVALVLTLITVFALKRHKNILMTYAQHFTGALFIFSGWVKAVDPLGTAYKMEQYFAEFEATFQGTWLNFIAPLFPWLSELSSGFSVFMIIFEIVLGIMLILGSKPKLTAWAFFLLVVFFTILTGFTYLTGYVPVDANFFEFSKWVAYDETSMRVTDCGCFGDFIKLEPRTSFFKDIFLLIPAIFFIWKHRLMHQLFSPMLRGVVPVLSTVALLFYCISNYVWDLPHADFRPFREGVDIAAQKQLETEAQESIQVIAYRITNKNNGEVVELPVAEYLERYQEFPKAEWELEQIKTEPTLESTKISDFELSDVDGNDVTEEILGYEGYHFLIVAYHIPNSSQQEVQMQSDTVWMVDTVVVEDNIELVRSPGEITQREIVNSVYTFPADYLEKYEQLNAMLSEAEAAGIGVHGVTGYAAPEMIDDFRHASQSAYPIYTADDILLKTIVRSNPGIVLMKDGMVVKKWHIRKLPSFEDIRTGFIK